MRFDKRFLHKSGNTLWADVSVRMVCDERGKPRFTIGHIVDITAKKRAEEALRESEMRHRGFFDQAADSIVVFDPKTTAILDFNDAACRRLAAR